MLGLHPRVVTQVHMTAALEGRHRGQRFSVQHDVYACMNMCTGHQLFFLYVEGRGNVARGTHPHIAATLRYSCCAAGQSLQCFASQSSSNCRSYFLALDAHDRVHSCLRHIPSCRGCPAVNGCGMYRCAHMA